MPGKQQVVRVSPHHDIYMRDMVMASMERPINSMKQSGDKIPGVHALQEQTHRSHANIVGCLQKANFLAITLSAWPIPDRNLRSRSLKKLMIHGSKFTEQLSILYTVCREEMEQSQQEAVTKWDDQQETNQEMLCNKIPIFHRPVTQQPWDS